MRGARREGIIVPFLWHFIFKFSASQVDKGAEVDPSPTIKAEVDDAKVDEDNKDVYFGAGGCQGR